MPMRYGDLIQTEPIESVIQLLDANRPDEARKLVSTYVISDDMAKRISKRMIPQLSFDEAIDYKGVLVVGNYGTGKSHLMSVLSLVAEDAAYVPMIQHPEVADASKAIAGKFKVHRIEISSQMSLRDIITQQLEVFLKKHNISYTFPPADQVINNKEAFEEMMAVFAEIYPSHGVLLVVDELLDYLRSRSDRDLVLDLSFLREIGEVTKQLRFRFVAGVQEEIFGSIRFQYVADSLRRVNDRFIEIPLVRQDISFVVSKRLLKKSEIQQNKIRTYLTPFAKFYGSMNERMDEYVRLFPVHPDYIGTFEQLVFTEKRGALVTVSDQIKAILSDNVPTNWPGLISYDKFWEMVKSNQVLRADPNIEPVLKVSEVLSERVTQAFAQPAYKPMALRIINGLSVYRLATGGDIHIPVGPTAEELRDTLCLFHPGVEEMGGEPEADLLSHVQTVLRETLKTVNGQFISKASNTEQYYLDLKKDIDYDAQIERRTEALSVDALNRAYYSVIRQLMERTDETTYVMGHQIWQHQIEWLDRRVERNGYLFFGAPNDRPTAQPERDFYIYYIQPFEPSRFRDDHKPDEVFFRLKGLDDTIRHHLSFYAAAEDLASTASGSAKAIYLDKAKGALLDMSKWLQEKQMMAYEVTYQGKAKTLQEWAKGISLSGKFRLDRDERVNFRDVINAISGLALNNQFAEAAPEYPKFSTLVTESNRKQLVESAIHALVVGKCTKDAMDILDGLEMLDGDCIDPTRSRYAKYILAQLKAKGPGQVLKRSELLSGNIGVEYLAPTKFRLEPDLLVIVLGGLVYAGDIVLSITGDKIDSSKLPQLAERSLDELQRFKHIEAPKEIDVKILRSLFEMLDQPPGLARQAAQGSDEPVKRLQEKVGILKNQVLNVTTGMQDRLTFWGRSLLNENEIADCRAKLSELKNFCERLALYDTIGKLKNLHMKPNDIAAQKENLKALAMVTRRLDLVAKLGGIASYLSQAEIVLPSDHAWVKLAQDTRRQTFDTLAGDQSVEKMAKYQQMLSSLKGKYISAYTEQHNKARLGIEEDRAKSALQQDSRLVVLRNLANVSLLPTRRLTNFEDKLDKLKSCVSLVESELMANPVCQHCNFRPANRQDGMLPFAPPPPLLPMS